MNPKRLTCHDYSLQIPWNAEVKAVPFDSLPHNVLQKFLQMDNFIDGSSSPHVIFVSPVFQNTLHNKYRTNTSPKPRLSEGNPRTRFGVSPNKFMAGVDDHSEDCFVPIRSSKEIASTIMKLSQSNNEKTTRIHDKDVVIKEEDTLLYNPGGVGIRARALYQYKNSMYLLPAQKSKVCGTMDLSSANHGTVKDEDNKIGQHSLSKSMRPDVPHYHHGPFIHMDEDNVLSGSVPIPQQGTRGQSQSESQFSRMQPAQSPPRSLNQLPLAMGQTKSSSEDVTPVHKRPILEGPDTHFRRKVGAGLSISSTMGAEAFLETSPWIPEEPSVFSRSPGSPPKVREEREEVSLAKPLVYTESRTQEPSYDDEGCTNLWSSSPLSAVTISTDTSEGFESDQYESFSDASLPSDQEEPLQHQTPQRLQPRECPSEQLKRTYDWEDVQAALKRPHLGASLINDERMVGTTSPSSSLMDLEESLEASSCIPEEPPAFPPDERAKPPTTSSSKLLSDTNPQNPHLAYNCEGCTNFDSESSSPSSAVTISTDTSEGFESVEEESASDVSPPPVATRTIGRATLRSSDETTQDERTQWLQQRVREFNEEVENIRAKKLKPD